MTKLPVAALLLACFALVRGAAGQEPPASEWLTWGYDQERTGWNRAETTLSKDNVSRLVLTWKSELPVAPREIALSTLTSPLVVEGVATPQGRRTLLFIAGRDDSVFAIDADSGKIVWQKTFPNALTPPQTATWLCSNTQNATPVIDKRNGIIYLNTSDGKLRGLSLATGDERLTPADFVTPFAKNWSLNLIDDVIYSPTARGCEGRRFLYVPMWGPPSKSAAPFPFSHGDAPRGSIMAFQVASDGAKLSLTPAWISRDMHVPDPPVVANGVMYAIQTGENTVQNPRPGGDIRRETDAQSGAGRGNQPPALSPQAAAKLRATPVTNLVLYAFDAQTGKQLYSSEQLIPGWVHYSEPVVAAGKVFVVTWDARVYAFGVGR